MSAPGSAQAANLSDAELAIWDADFVNEEHLKAFEVAMEKPEQAGDLSSPSLQSPIPPTSPTIPSQDQSFQAHQQTETDGWASHPLRSPPQAAHTQPESQELQPGPDQLEVVHSQLQIQEQSDGETVNGVSRLAATSDFAPVHSNIRKRRPDVSQGLTYHLLRWPLLGGLFLAVFIEFGAYLYVRQLVNLFEWLVVWRGKKKKIRERMRSATSYEEWCKYASEMDTYLGFEKWKDVEDDGFYDFTLVSRVKRTLARQREKGDVKSVMDTLAVCVRADYAGTGNVKIYCETFLGTKKLVEEYQREVVRSLDMVRMSSDISNEQKRAFFKSLNKNYGASGLCLSGGASFAYYHFGVVRALLDANLLPRVIAGTSAGALVAALVCTRTDAELRRLLVPKLADKITACQDPFVKWGWRWLRTGARFSAVEWAKKATFFTMGSMTFQEAYNRTGRVLNVSVVPHERYSPTILLNHLSAPNCIIWSAILASAAVPGILPPIVLMAKDANGKAKPYNLAGARFKDGSLREDIPLAALHNQFNVRFSIVSQTNPHIHLFFFAPRGSVGRPVAHRKGKGWRGGFLMSAFESFIKLDLAKYFKVIRDLDLLPEILQSDWSGVFLQRFSGDLTITPRSKIRDWPAILSDPDQEKLAIMLHTGQRVTWPTIRMLQNRMKIERAITRGRMQIRLDMQLEKPTTDPNTSDGGITHEGDDGPFPPIESDADSGWEDRKRQRGVYARPIGTSSTGHASSVPRYLTRRMNRGGAATGGDRANRSPRADRTERTESSERGAARAFPSGASTSGTSGNVATTSASSAPRSYAETLGDTIRHVRTTSISALADAVRSPFRSNTSLSSPQADDDRRRSRSSLSRLWSGWESSSEEGDLEGREMDDYLEEIGGSNESAEWDAQGSAIIDEED